MIRMRSWLRCATAVLALASVGCNGDSTGPSHTEGAASVQLDGAETRSWDGTSTFYVGENLHAGGRLEFTLYLEGRGVSERDAVVVQTLGGRPTVGKHGVALAGGKFRAFNFKSSTTGATVLYAAEHGEVEITHSSAELVEGRLRYTAFQYCEISETGVTVGPCVIPAGPIPGARRVEVTATFSAIHVDAVPIDTIIMPAALEFYGDSTVVHVPASVAVGQPITVRIQSYGGGCEAKARTDVSVEGRTVTIQPMNSVVVGAVCLDILKKIEHTAEVTFDSPGPVNIRIRGVKRPQDETVLVERTVDVR